MPDGTFRWKRVLVCALLIALLGIPVCLLLISRWQARMPLLPNPNGCDDFLAVLKLRRAYPILQANDNPTVEELCLNVQTNRPALDRLRLGLSRQCRVPWQSQPNEDERSMRRVLFLSLVSALETEGRLAEIEDRTWDAAKADLDIIRFGQESARGGVLREKGFYPGSMADLVPDYLRSVPMDPFAGKPLVYRTAAQGFQLYSVGSDGKDDGGKPLARAAKDAEVAEGDIPFPQSNLQE